MAIYKGDKKIDASAIEMPISTSITSSSTNDEVAGAKAVYDLLQIHYIKSNKTTVQTVNLTNSSFTTINGYTTELNSGFTVDDTNGIFTANFDAPICILYAQIQQNNISSASSSTASRIKITRTRNNTVVDVGAITQRQVTNVLFLTCFGITDIKNGDVFKVETNTSASTDQSVRLEAGINTFSVVEIPSTTVTSLLNTTRFMNTGSLVGMGDRAELTSLANEVADKDVGEQEVTPLETTEEKTEGSGDIL